jgi:hypothetical protein
MRLMIIAQTPNPEPALPVMAPADELTVRA